MKSVNKNELEKVAPIKTWSFVGMQPFDFNKKSSWYILDCFKIKIFSTLKDDSHAACVVNQYLDPP